VTLIDELWQRTGERPGIHLFDGPLCRLESFSVDEAGLHLNLSPNSYKNFIGTNVHHPTWADDYGPQVMANPVGTSVLLRTADSALVGGRRSQAVALYPGCAHPFGGTLEPGVDGKPPDLIDEIRRELSEEVALIPSDLSDLRVIGLVEDRQLRQPELTFIATTTLTSQAIAARLDHAEHDALWQIPDNSQAIESALLAHTTTTPVLAATLLSYGQWQFGDAWLQQQLNDFHQDARQRK
jgi:hypothetical protein